MAGKQKLALWELGFGGWLGGSLNGDGIQFVCSSWAKKMITLRLKSGGMGLFDNLFVSVVNLGVLCYYVVNGALHINWF